VVRFGQGLTLDAQPKVPAQTSGLEARATATLPDRNSAEMAGVVVGVAIEDLPVNGRHWANLPVLAPGATTGVATSEPRSARS